MPSGTVRRYFSDIKIGTIEGNGRIYMFAPANWISAGEPKAGMKVAFELADSHPVNIRVVEGEL